MRKPPLDAMSVDQLVALFADIGIAQDRALLHGDLRAFKRLFREMEAVEEQLKSRPGDRRDALAVLYDHPNMQVRVKAAKATLAVMPQAARAQLAAVRAANWQPQSLEAGMSLRNLDSGVFKPE